MRTEDFKLLLFVRVPAQERLVPPTPEFTAYQVHRDQISKQGRGYYVADGNDAERKART